MTTADQSPANERVLKDAIDTRQTPDLDTDAGSPKKVLAILKRALKAAHENPSEAVKLAQRALEADPENAMAHHVAGLAYDRGGVLSRPGLRPGPPYRR